MNVTDTLTTISPITDMLAQENNQGADLNFAAISGCPLRSYLSFVRERIPFDSKVLKQGIDDLKSVFSIKDLKEGSNNDKYIVVSQ